MITVGIEFEGKCTPLTMCFRHTADELVYCAPDDAVLSNRALLRHAASLNVEFLHAMSGLVTEEASVMPGRIKTLMGQGQTGQILRNLCAIVAADAPQDWQKIVALMARLFQVTLLSPVATSRGTIELQYKQLRVKDALDISASGRGFQQMLLMFAFLYSHKKCVLLIDEPDNHLEILRQKQVYVLLRDIASENGSQVIMSTHSEVILNEAFEHNLTLLIDGRAEQLAKRNSILNHLKYFGADHYIRARERGYVLYVEGGTDIDMLHALAQKLSHPISENWDERINTFYVRDNYPDITQQSELERVEGGYGLNPKEHFRKLRDLLPNLKGLAILDSDSTPKKEPEQEGELQVIYWQRYEAENYFVTPDLLRQYAINHSPKEKLLQIDEVLNTVVTTEIFDSNSADFLAWKKAPQDLSRIVWEAKTERKKLSNFAEYFFRELAKILGTTMLLKKGELHRLIALVDAETLAPEVGEKLTALQRLF
jgi:ABC-type cobalamin transport system ATPase subunit